MASLADRLRDFLKEKDLVYKVEIENISGGPNKDKITLRHKDKHYELIYNHKTKRVTTGSDNDEPALSDDYVPSTNVKDAVVEFFKHKGGARTRRIRRKKRSTR